MVTAVSSVSAGSSSIDTVLTEFRTRAVILSSILLLFSDQFFGAFFDTFNFHLDEMAPLEKVTLKKYTINTELVADREEMHP